jgi:hypothetical protein
MYTYSVKHPAVDARILLFAYVVIIKTRKPLIETVWDLSLSGDTNTKCECSSSDLAYLTGPARWSLLTFGIRASVLR